MPRISLRKIDALLNGELGPAEAERVRKEIEASPEARSYFERQADLRADRRWERLRRDAERDGRSRGKIFGKAVLGAVRRTFSRGGAPGYLGAAFGAAALVLGAMFWALRGHEDRGSESRMAAKGLRAAEAGLRFHGRDFGPGSSIPAGAGDTLGFVHRGTEPVDVQIWYREDGGEILPLAPGHPDGFAWPAATAWTLAPQSIRLEGSWRRQDVWIVLSRRPLDPARAREAIRAGKREEGVQVLAFRLERGR
jgi:hypothetical protein